MEMEEVLMAKRGGAPPLLASLCVWVCAEHAGARQRPVVGVGAVPGRASQRWWWMPQWNRTFDMSASFLLLVFGKGGTVMRTMICRCLGL